MNFLWLKTFYTLTQTGSFTETADKLAMTQPGVSQHLKKLELELDQTLLLREEKPFEITPQGKEVFEYARVLIEGEKHLKQSLKEDNPYIGSLEIACPGGVGLMIYPWMLDCQQQWPELNCKVRFNPTGSVEQMILNGESDVGFITHHCQHPELIVETFVDEKLWLIAPKSMPDASFCDLKEIGYIDHPDCQAYLHQLLNQLYPDCDIDIDSLKTSGYINHTGLICEPVARGIGYSVMPEFVVRLSPVVNQLRVVEPDKPVTQTISIIYKKKWPLPSRYHLLIETLRENLEQILP